MVCLIFLALCKKFDKGFHSHSVIYYCGRGTINADKKIKGVQIGDHETKQEILLITPPTFLRDITCLT